MCIAKRPLKPSIRFDPLTIKRKHSNTKIIEKMSFLSHEFKKFKSIEMEVLRDGKLIGFSRYLFRHKDDFLEVKNQTKFEV